MTTRSLSAQRPAWPTRSPRRLQSAARSCQWADDATTTAEIKTRLLANSNTHGLQINVDTKADVVTLTGKVASTEEAALAEQIASNVESVGRKRIAALGCVSG